MCVMFVGRRVFRQEDNLEGVASGLQPGRRDFP